LEILSSARSSNGGCIETLRLLNTAVSDAAFVNGLVDALAPSLRELRLSGGRIGLGDGALEWMVEMDRCHALERLALGGLSFSDAAFTIVFRSARGLLALHLRDTNVTDDALVALGASCPSLKEVGISDANITDVGVQALHLLPLESLRLGGCPYVSNRGITELLDAVGPRLLSLSLEHCKMVKGACLTALQQGVRWSRLQHLRLIGVKLTGAELEWCSEHVLPDLRRLEVWLPNWPRCFEEAEKKFHEARPQVILVLRRSGHGTLGWANW